jgi:hypothetical protein
MLEVVETSVNRGRAAAGGRRLSGKAPGLICPDDGRFYPERTTGALDPEQGLVS